MSPTSPQQWAAFTAFNSHASSLTGSPTASLPHNPNTQVLLLLDALDEGDKPTAVGGSHAASSLDNKALQLLLHQLSLLPPSVRVLATLRPEPHLLDPIRSRFPRLHELSLSSLRRPDKTAGAMQVRGGNQKRRRRLQAGQAGEMAGGGSSLGQGKQGRLQPSGRARGATQ